VNLLNNQAPGDRTLSVLRDASGNTINTANQNVISSAGALLNIDNLNVAQGAVRISPPANIAVVDGNFVVVQLNRGSTNVNNPEREIVFEFNADQSATAGNRVLAQQVNGSRQVVEVKIGTGTDMTPQAELGALVNAMKANGIGARVNNDGTLDIMAGGLTGVAYSLTDSAGTPVAASAGPLWRRRRGASATRPTRPRPGRPGSVRWVVPPPTARSQWSAAQWMGPTSSTRPPRSRWWTRPSRR
jgi:hypothetical protein